MLNAPACIRRANTQSPLAYFFLLLMPLWLGACGGGPIDSTEVYEGSVLGQRPTTMREGGEPVTGTVVTTNADEIVISEIEYVDGFPNGRMREWYNDGKPKSDDVVRYVDRGATIGGLLETVGDYKAWCENGTLRSDLPRDSDGKAVGTHKTWDCDSNLTSEAEMPEGPFHRWHVLEGGERILAEEGQRDEKGQLLGEHKVYDAKGEVLQFENWNDGKMHGEYKRLSPDGSVHESGRYENGEKAGTWMQSFGGDVYQVWDYEPENFTKQEYVSPFLQAAGIPETTEGGGVLGNYVVDADKIRYYVTQGLVDVKKKLNVDVRSNYQTFQSHIWTYPFIQASRDALPVLLELGADPKAIDSNLRTRLHYCIESLYQRICTPEDIQSLIALGIDVKQADARGNTALHRLMNYYRVPDENNRYGAMRQAQRRDLEPMIRMLVDAGADPDAQAFDGKTAMIIALQTNMYDVAEALLEISKKPGQLDKAGLNVIHHAFMVPGLNQVRLDLPDDRKAFVEKAAKMGVDPAQPMGGGDTLIDIAEQNGAIELAQFLRQLKT
jgi:antitoxin component YwqK of YwqJK toxin-antitoxin module/ankyrin repeat protein